jgi:hypothetical protein
MKQISVLRRTRLIESQQQGDQAGGGPEEMGIEEDPP